MDKSEKPWICRNCREKIGIVRKNGSGIDRLYLPGGVMIEGYARVPCPRCGMTRDWIPGQEAMDRLITRMKGR